MTGDSSLHDLQLGPPFSGGPRVGEHGGWVCVSMWVGGRDGGGLRFEINSSDFNPPTFNQPQDFHRDFVCVCVSVFAIAILV